MLMSKVQFLSLALLSCAPTIATQQPLPAAEGWKMSSPDPSVSSDLEPLKKATLDVIASRKFIDLVASRTDLRGSLSSGEIDGHVVAAAYWGVTPNWHMVPVTISVGDASANAQTGLEDNGTRAVTVFSPNVLSDWKGNLVRKSCAVNTFAHELTHTVVEVGSDGSGVLVFADRGHRWGNRLLYLGHRHHFVSYAIGAIAQCVYLDNNGLVKPGGMDACIEHWGVFDTTDCDASWQSR